MKALIVIHPDWTKEWGNPKRMHEYVNCKIEYRDVTEQEIVDLRIPEAMVTVKIPLEVFIRSEELQNKIRAIDLIYNGLDRRTIDGYVWIENIDTHDVPEYLSMEEYLRMKEAGVIFPPEIISIYENNGENVVENWEENEENDEEEVEEEEVSNEEE